MDVFSPVESLGPMHVSPVVPIAPFTAKELDLESRVVFSCAISSL